MNSKVVETEDKVFIDKIPQLKWGENADNSFIRSAQLTLNALGEKYSYDFLMGISGAAFRLHFKPDWCPSSADATTGYDVSKVLFKSLGYDAELYKIDDNEFEDIKALYKKIIARINLGIPIIAINLKVCPEWGIITGYLKNKPGILCRTYFDKTEEYSLAEHAPWLSFFIGEKDNPLSEDELFKNSLKIAVELAKTDKFEEYKSGYNAFKKWIEELKTQAESIKTFLFKEYEINLTIFNSLLDSRKAAVGYLTLMKDKMQKGDLIIDNYKKEVELLTETQKNVLPSFKAKANSWTADIINKQVDLLTQILRIEKKTIHLFEDEFKC